MFKCFALSESWRFQFLCRSYCEFLKVSKTCHLIVSNSRDAILTICYGIYERIGGIPSESVSKSFLMTRVRPGLIICKTHRLSWALKPNVTRLRDASFYTPMSVMRICEISQALLTLPRLLILVLLQILKKNQET